MQKKNYQAELDGYLASLDPCHPPRLLLHGCCAPCSSYVLEYLSAYFAIALYFYNPNISSREEYDKRAEEERRLLSAMPLTHPAELIVPPWEHEVFLRAARGVEEAPEGGERCRRCFALRMSRAAEAAKAGGFDCFATTLTISPLKNADLINTIGAEAGARWGVPYIPTDFKKKGGYLRSIELSRRYDLYRQDFCGCEFSYAARHGAEPPEN